MKPYYALFGDAPDLNTAIRDLEGFWKFLSILHLKLLSLPTLEGIIVTTWNRRVELALHDLCAQRGWSSLLLRHDKSPESPRAPSGGYLVPIGRLEQECRKYMALGRILLFLEPHSPWSDFYSLNFLFEGSAIRVEIVGPGFDASDLQRGDITPHETIVIDSDALRGRSSLRALSAAIREHTICAEEQYKRSVALRFLKIARRLIDLQEIRAPGSGATNGLASIAKRYLTAHNYRALINAQLAYTPIERNKLAKALEYVLSLPYALSRYGYELPIVVSSSYLDDGNRFVLWDVVQPKLKYKVPGIRTTNRKKWARTE